MSNFSSLIELKTVKKELQAQEKARLQAKAQALCIKQQQQNDSATFANAMAELGVKTLARNNDRVSHKKAPNKSSTMSMVECFEAPTQLSDLSDPQTFIEEEHPYSARSADCSPDIPKKIYQGFWPVQAKIDLHGMTVEMARSSLASFLTQCETNRLRCVLIVHGVGYNSTNAHSVLKTLVPRWLKQWPRIMAFTQAPPNKGANGALLVLFEKYL